MNKFKTNITKIGVLLSVGAVLYSCEVDRNRNIDDVYSQTQAQLTQDATIIKTPLTTAQNMIIVAGAGNEWMYQIQQNLNADMFSGFMAANVMFGNNTNNATYSLVPGWNAEAWDVAYQNGVMDNTTNAIKLAQDANLPQYEGLARIIRVEGMHRLSDIYGPIIYTHFGQNESGDQFDSQQDVYTAFFSDLDQGITALEQAQQNGLEIAPDADMSIYGGNIAQWIKFANSLRLRLALRISNVDPATAETQAKKAFTDGHFLTDNSDNFMINSPNPIEVITSSWMNIAPNASMESYLKGYNDPRLPVYFTKSRLDGGYHGVRLGINITSDPQYQPFSEVGSGVLGQIQLMTSAEVQFLIAEARIKGWDNSGTAQEAYENGIKLSFVQRGVALGDYLNTTTPPAPYVDPLNAANNATLSTMISVKWSSDPQTELQQIWTQKWIAMYPEGQEAWSEVRRTGFPTLYPVVVNKSGGIINTNKGVRRLPFPDDEKATNAANVAAAVQMLKGPDTGATNLWWDTSH